MEGPLTRESGRTDHPSRSDIALAVGLAAVGAVEGAILGEDTAWIGLAVLQVGAAVPLAWRRINPAVVAVTVATAIAAINGSGNGDEVLASFLCLLLAMFSLGLHADRRGFWVGLGASFAIVASWILVTGEGPDDVVFAGSIILATAIPGRLVRRRIDEVAAATERAVRAEVHAEDRARLAALEERNRLAYELHDIVGHSVSLMAVHAAAAESHLDDPERTRASLHTVQDVGRQAIGDLARMLGLLRDDHAELGLAVQPGACDLERLAADARAGGDPLTMTVEGDVERVPPALGLTLYRVVQEGLTNARRHAPGAPVHATVQIGRRSMSVEVVNAPRDAPAAPGSGTGTGLLGLRQRVAMFGGSIHSGVEPDGGYALRASLPIGGEA